MINPRGMYACLISLSLFTSGGLMCTAYAVAPAPNVAPEPAGSNSSTNVPQSAATPPSDKDLWSEMRARFQLTVANRAPIEQ
jgi:hypothetical protein